MKPGTTLHTITNRLLNAAPDEYALLFDSSKKLYELLVNTVQLDTDSPVNRGDNHLQSGKAIGATWAALCIQDLLRTKKFMDGIYHAVIKQQQNKPGQPIHILYAGTGPFATLLLPLIARFDSDELQFTLLEVNEESFQHLQRTIDIFEWREYVHEMYCTDATTYKIKTGLPVDMLISETMQQALVKEPQVAIMMNLVPQLPGDCVVIPEKITLEAALVNEQKRTARKLGTLSPDEEVMQGLGPVFELSRSSIKTFHPAANGYNHLFPPITIHIPPGVIDGFPMLTVQTTIQVFQNDVLLPDQCGLTLPLTLANLTAKPKTKKVIFRYAMGVKPGLQYELIHS